MTPGELTHLLEVAHAAWTTGKRTALATLVKVQGSAYRREGAKMLIAEDGAMACMISGGCLEPEVAEVARGVIERQRPECVHYDLDEETVWGLGLGCGGAVDVYLEPIAPASFLASWLELQARGELSALATVLSGGEGRVWLGPQGAIQAGEVTPASLAAPLQDAARTLLAQAAPRATTKRLSGPSGEAEVFIDVSSPPLELVLFGGGHDARPLAQSAQALGFHVSVVDPRPTFVNAETFPGATLILAHPSAFAHRVTLTRRSYVVVMNHHLERDKESLAFVLASEAPYVGVLGPRSRYLKLLEALAREGRAPTPAALTKARNPIGLAIGAEGPDEIALSILGEILALSRGFSGGFLHGWEGRIHEPKSKS